MSDVANEARDWTVVNARHNAELRYLNEDIDRYKRDYELYKVAAIILRTSAFLTFAAGFLLPFTSFIFGKDQSELVSAGYFFLLVSGILLLADTTFSVTKSRIGYLVALTELLVQRETYELGLEKAKKVEESGQSNAALEYVDLSAKTRQQITKKETLAWIAAYTESLDALKNKLEEVNKVNKPQSGAAKPEVGRG